MLSISVLIFLACGTTSAAVTETQTATQPAIVDVTATQTFRPIATITPTPQSISAPTSLGPERADFTYGYNPLSGQLVDDPNLLQIPALLISVSHFPAIARPQAGLSFAPWIFEFYITEGATRFLSVFHGEYPEPEIPVTGDCEIRAGVFTQTSIILGNQVWLDKNKNGRHEPFESGVGGICVKIQNAYQSITICRCNQQRQTYE